MGAAVFATLPTTGATFLIGLTRLTRALKQWKPEGYEEALEDQGLISLGEWAAKSRIGAA